MCCQTVDSSFITADFQFSACETADPPILMEKHRGTSLSFVESSFFLVKVLSVPNLLRMIRTSFLAALVM